MTIAIARERAGLTQAQLAERLSVTQGAVSQWEQRLTFPRMPLLLRLADVLGCTVDELIRDEPEEKTERTG